MAQFEFDGRKVTVIPPRELTLGDLAFIKQFFDIESQSALEDGLGNLDPDAWRGLLIASVRRNQPDVSPTHGGIDGVAVTALLEQMNEETMAYLEAKEAEDAKAEGGGGRPTGGSSSTRGKRGARK
ncbi:MAG: hypothetical protein AB7G65_07110 [Thermoleophilia bacterium]